MRQPSQHNNSEIHDDELWMVEWLEVYCNVLCLNSWQVNRYFQQYAKSRANGFSSDDLVILSTLYKDAQSFSREWSERAPNLDAVIALLSNGVDRYTKYLHAAAALARSKWTKFSDGLMTFGVLILLVSLFIQIKAVYMFIVLGSASLPGKIEDHINVLPLQEMITNGFIFGLISAGASTVISVLACVFSGGSVSLSKTQVVIIFTGGTVLGTAKSYLIAETLQSTCYSQNRILRISSAKWLAYSDLIGWLAVLFCCIHACSLLSNSFILREQQVVTFFLISIGLLDLRMALQQKSKVLQALCFLILNFIMGSLSGVNFLKENGYQTGETTAGKFVSSYTSSTRRFLFAVCTVHVPLIAIGCALVKKLWRSCLFSQRYSKVVLHGLPCTYAAICLHWLLDDLDTSQLLCIPGPAHKFARLLIPRTVYSAVAFETVLLLFSIMDARNHSEIQLKNLFEEASLALVAVLSSLIVLLLGRHGPIVVLTAGLEVWCLREKQLLYASTQQCPVHKKQPLYASPQPCQVDKKAVVDYSPATIQWSLLAVQIFFCTGHRCSFDGLHYAAAFIGFDHFNIYRQGTLLALDTFGASHILPILGLPLLVSKRTPSLRTIPVNEFYKMQISQDLLMFELVRTITTTFTTLCVTIQRRHLMVWGLFAPKFVFDAIGLLVTDVFVLFGFLYVMGPFLLYSTTRGQPDH